MTTEMKKVKNQIGISKFKIVRAVKNQPNQIQFKTSFEGDYEILATRKCKNDVNVINYRLNKAYQAVQGLPKAKFKVLLALCKSNIIPPAYHQYYQSFTEKLNLDDEENDD